MYGFPKDERKVTFALEVNRSLWMPWLRLRYGVKTYYIYMHTCMYVCCDFPNICVTFACSNHFLFIY